MRCAVLILALAAVSGCGERVRDPAVHAVVVEDQLAMIVRLEMEQLGALERIAREIEWSRASAAPSTFAEMERLAGRVWEPVDSNLILDTIPGTECIRRLKVRRAGE